MAPTEQAEEEVQAVAAALAEIRDELGGPAQTVAEQPIGPSKLEGSVIEQGAKPRNLLYGSIVGNPARKPLLIEADFVTCTQ
mmetsp:Transcript_54643/g.96999  ORF Transcript_54643/g.96999 Transcript_54643/m.96999 type:complete len:82 (-) Transcript_54643:1031-1276(-)